MSKGEESFSRTEPGGSSQTVLVRKRNSPVDRRWLAVRVWLILIAGLLTVGAGIPRAQSIGAAGTVTGSVLDPDNAVVVGAAVSIENSATGFSRTTKTDEEGSFRFENIPPNNYQITTSAAGFRADKQNVTVRSLVPLSLKIVLEVGEFAASVTVEGNAYLVENIPSSHTDLDQGQISKLPISASSSGLSDAVTYAAPGVVADSNGFFHPLGDHAQTTLSLDNQPISDQQSKAFSTQIPLNAIQSMEVITGATAAEYGDKTSLVISAITRSGLGLTKPVGSLSYQYGSFGASNVEGTLGMGNSTIGNFTAFNFERSGRFLDSPEFTPLHDEGKSAGIFDHFDFRPTPNDTIHLNLQLARNRFEVPNTFDQQALGQNQRQLVRTLNVAPGYVHAFSPSTVMTVNPYYRLDQIWYTPSENPVADATQTIGQERRLTNVGLRADIAFASSIHNAKVGLQVSHTFLTEAFRFGITDPGFNDPASASFIPGLLPYDLTRGGRLFQFNGHTDIKQEAFYAQDALTLRQLTLSLGLRFDNYNGFTRAHAFQPRAGFSYHFKPTNTVLRGSYTRSFETPYNENLILSSFTAAGGLADGTLGDATSQPLKPGRRNQFNVGFQQGLGGYVVIDVDCFWKHTRNAYDFGVLLNTPIAFPISWNKSKVDGVSLRATLAPWKGWSAFFVGGHTRARYFPPESGGLFFNSDIPEGVFRIDHDQAFQQSTQVQYQFEQLGKQKPYLAFTWRYDSGLVAGSVPDFASAVKLTPDQQAQIGLFCGSVFATPTQGLTGCASGIRGATRVQIPPDGTANDDHNPPRLVARHLLSLGIGTDNLLSTERARVTLRLSGLNLTNKDALYNFLSTFSGTHFVAPRTWQGQIGLVF